MRTLLASHARRGLDDGTSLTDLKVRCRSAPPRRLRCDFPLSVTHTARPSLPSQSVELKELCKERGLPVSGRKVQLAARLTEWLTTNSDEPTPKKSATKKATSRSSRKSARISSGKSAASEDAPELYGRPATPIGAEAHILEALGSALEPQAFPGMYPTIAISDAFNAYAHYWAAATCLEGGQPFAAVGFGSVALAALVGTARFALSERLEPYNTLLANFAGAVGMPLLGAHFVSTLLAQPLTLGAGVFLALALTTLSMFNRTTGRDYKNDETLLQVVAYVIPAAVWGVQQRSAHVLAALVVGIVGALVIGPSSTECSFCGVRNANLFHYALGAGALLLAKGLNGNAALPWE